jgi:benzylsuccinate CoA-transferase BbsF subunit
MKALEDVKIADFTWVAAGPLTTTCLAQFGATVVRIESISRPDGQRTFPPNKDGIPGVNRSFEFSADNLNKYGMTINMKHPEGMKTAKELIAWADIVAENFRPGQMEKWKLGYEDLKEINSSIIMFRSSAQGQSGPYAKMGMTGIQLQSWTGFTSLTGWPDRDPSPPWGAYTDLTVPGLGVAVICAALDYRKRTGKGQCIDLAQFEASLHFLAPSVLDYTANGRVATRMGNTCPYAAPHGLYRCKGDDRWCTIAVFDDKEWKAFCGAIGNPEWTADTKFATVMGRKEHEAELNRLVEAWTIHYSPEEVMICLQDAGVSAGIVENAQDMLEDPQLKERGIFQRLNHDELGFALHRGPAFQLSKTPWELTMPGPCLGQHTEYVCREFLGMSDEEFVERLSSGAFD